MASKMRKRRQIASALRRQLQVSDARLLIAGQSTDAHQPPHRRCHAPDNVLAESRRQLRVVTVRTNRQQLLRPRRSLLGIVQGHQIPLLNQRGMVGLQSSRKR